jgi:1,4-dihydroxy-6-naphthoate synthase
MTPITLGFSPCPNDTFIFDALVHGKIDTEGLEFNYLLADVEQLNQKAFRGELEVTKLSFNAFLHLAHKYILLNSGAAMGINAGPLLVSKKPATIGGLAGKRIGIPGKNTTANLLLSLAAPKISDKVEMLFSDIEDAVISGEIDAGLIIHESRFTYQHKGLFKVADLGEFWEEKTQCPIPLGGIVASRNLPGDVIRSIDRVLKRSVEYAFANPGSSAEFVRTNAQEMDEDVMNKHIELYVNMYSIELGVEGRKAVGILFHEAVNAGIILPDLSASFIVGPDR